MLNSQEQVCQPGGNAKVILYERASFEHFKTCLAN